MPWTKLSAHIATSWKQGQHVTLLGKAGSGKTHVALELADSRRDAVVFATKRRDPLLTQATQRGYKLVSSMREVPTTETGHPVYHKVVVWPGVSAPNEKARLALQAFTLRETIEIAERQGHWTILLDETMWAYDMLRVRAELESVWYQARSSGVSLIACAQRPTKIPRQMIAQASHLFMWYVSDKRDIESLREIAGVTPPEVIEANLPALSWERHEFLYVGADTGYVARSIAPPR